MKRLRVFAGPNGSGKTTIIRNLITKIPFGVYVNADDIELILARSGSLDFSPYKIEVAEPEIREYFRDSKFSAQKRNEDDLVEKLKVIENRLFLETQVDSYLSAGIADFIRNQLIKKGISFSFETVMSHEGKVHFMQYARELGYRVYLYFIATSDPAINVNRVGVRVAQNGHHVAEEIIVKRYFRSLELLLPAVLQTNRAYLFDNSGIAANLVAEITNGADVQIVDPAFVPDWIHKYLFD